MAVVARRFGCEWMFCCYIGQVIDDGCYVIPLLNVVGKSPSDFYPTDMATIQEMNQVIVLERHFDEAQGSAMRLRSISISDDLFEEDERYLPVAK